MLLFPFAGDNSPAISGPYLQDGVLSLKGLEIIPKRDEPVEAAPQPITASSSMAAPERKPANKKPTKPKWLKL